jgi:hypothetical protein
LGGFRCKLNFVPCRGIGNLARCRARAKLIEKRGNDLIIRDIAMLESMVEDTLES